ncbi:T9SS type A sorting domain-containing protein [Kordia sp.]|uniref:T9SS type A sorting domain-containing protein n=1 Tax=Kordia sp. TaxID=1965332 RepID=UPI0025C356FF|nr:T9SS type A sorting domain-containing protein [Kordia sp.]MCH2196992.1 T9SS type A sorting domain-containing protein [Kordia sp.]
MKTRLLFLCFFLGYMQIHAQWSQVGTAQFTNFASDSDFAFDASGNPYVIYKDVVSGGWPDVKMFDGTNWVSLGTSGTWGASSAELLAIAINPVTDMPWVAWKEGSVIKVYSYDGTNWNFDSQPPLWAPQNVAPLEFVFNSSNEPVIYYHKSGGTSSLRDYVRVFKQAAWGGNNIWNSFSSSAIVTTDRRGESILNELAQTSNSSQVRALNAIGGVKFTINASSLSGKRFNKLSMIQNYWVGNDVISGTSGISFGEGTNQSLPQPQNTGGNTGNHLKLVDRTVGNLLYLMYSDASNGLQMQRYNTTSSQWSMLPSLGISTTGAGFEADVEVNPVDNALYALYIDSGRLSMQKFEEVPALSKYYVNANVSGGDGSGDSWANAMTSVTDALSSADNNTTEIWIAGGTYKPGTGRSDSFVLGLDGLTIYGGFDGTETAISERDILNNPTIFSGDINDDDTGVGMVNTTRNDNSYHVVDVDANNITLDGIQINDGHANGSSTNAYGGAVLIRSTSENLTFRHCEFNQNIGLTGGAIRVYYNVNTGITFENCKFFNNISRYGSGLYLLVNTSRTVTLDMTNCLFYQNISVDQNSSNRGFTGSALWARANTSGSNLTTTINNCTFGNNLDRGTTATSQYGTLALSRRTDGSSSHTATINNSIFYYNDQGVSGVTGVSINPGHTSFPNTVFVNNSISEDSFSNLTFLTNTSGADPLFTDPNNNDFSLQTGSPAIDSGDNTKVPAGITSDILFNQRIHNTTVDMGVYEFGASSTLSTTDFDADQDVVTVYPNPVKNMLHINSTIHVETIKVFSINGQQLLQAQDTNTLDVSNLQKGIYLVQIASKNASKTIKVLKQ